MRLYSIAFLLLSFLSGGSSVAGELSKEVQNKLVERMEALQIEGKIPGLSVTTFTNEGIQFSKALGRRSLGDSKGVHSKSTMFPLSSVSKLFTTLSVFQLIDKGEFDLSTPLSKLVKSHFHKIISSQCSEKMSHLKSITVGHLLSHQAGISQDLTGANLWWDASALNDGAYPSHQTFDENFCQTDFIFEAGNVPTGMKYSNLGFNLLGQIVAAYGGHQSLEGYVGSEILTPLKMKNTRYSMTRQTADSFLATAYGNPGSLLGGSSDDRTALPMVLDPQSYAGSIGVNSSSEDLALLGNEMLAWINQESARFPNLAQHWRKILQPKSHNLPQLSWANGFMLFNTKSSDFKFHNNGTLCFGHTGTNYGSRAILYVCPQLNWGFSAVFNARNANRERFMLEVSQILADHNVLKYSESLSKDVSGWMNEVAQFQEQTIVSPPPKVKLLEPKDYPEDLKDYAGKYHSDTTGAEVIGVSDNNKLVMWGRELLPVSEDLFRFPAVTDPYSSGEPVQFIRDKNGRVVKILAAHVLNAPKIE
ncbi:serine hydrolase [bacterium]|nr:serine hydrolase [bacterium]